MGDWQVLIGLSQKVLQDKNNSIYDVMKKAFMLRATKSSLCWIPPGRGDDCSGNESIITAAVRASHPVLIKKQRSAPYGSGIWVLYNTSCAWDSKMFHEGIYFSTRPVFSLVKIGHLHLFFHYRVRVNYIFLIPKLLVLLLITTPSDVVQVAMAVKLDVCACVWPFQCKPDFVRTSSPHGDQHSVI